MLEALLRRPISIAIATVALVVIGGFSLTRLPVSLLPTLERPRLVVMARDAEMSRDELRRQVVEPLERRLLSLRGVLDVLARVDDGEATVVLDTEWQTDVDRLRIDAERRLADVAGLGLDELSIEVVSGDRQPIVAIAVLAGSSAHERTTFVDRVLIPEVGRLPGAGRLQRLGGAVRRPVVRPRAADLAAYGLTASDVASSLLEVGSQRPLGRLRDGAEVRPLVLGSTVRSLDDLVALRVGPGSGLPLGQVATVGLEEVPDPGVFRLNGQEGVVLEVHRAPGANAVVLVREVRRLLRELSPRAAGLHFEVVHDASTEVVEALRQLASAGLLGLLLGAGVLRWGLGSWRPTLALMVVVPASICIAFGGFYLWGISLDVVSLAGLALAAGMLVDNSIVVLEAIASARRDETDTDRAVLRGTGQIALALVASLVTTAVVFLPLLYLQGLARAFFGVQAFGIVTTLAISLALSLTLTPVLARRLARRGGTVFRPGRELGRATYAAFLERAVRHPIWVVALTLLVLVVGVLVGLQLDRELVPVGPSQVAEIELTLPASLTPETLRLRVADLEASLEATLAALTPPPEAEIELWVRDRDPTQERQEPGLLGTAVLRFDSSEALEQALPALERTVEGWAGTLARVERRWGAVAQSVRRGAQGLEVEVSAPEAPQARRLAETVQQAAAESWGTALHEQGTTPGGARLGRPALQVRRDPWRIEQAAGESLAGEIRWALGGRLTGRLVSARMAPEILLESTLPSDPALLPVRGGEGRVVPLAAVAHLEPRSLAAPEPRRNGRPSVRLAMDPTVRVAPGKVEDWLRALPRAGDERVELVGHGREMGRAFSQLRMALGLALVLVFLAIAALYESFAMPWVVMITVPVAAAGAVVALALAGQSLNVMSFLGLILLAGIVVNNAIVLVHRGEQRIRAGESRHDALRAAALERYRPIIMTTLTTVLGMVPLALLGGEGVELRRSLALAVIGGSTTALLAALLVVPVLARVLVRGGGRRAGEAA